MTTRLELRLGPASISHVKNISAPGGLVYLGKRPNTPHPGVWFRPGPDGAWEPVEVEGIEVGDYLAVVHERDTRVAAGTVAVLVQRAMYTAVVLVASPRVYQVGAKHYAWVRVLALSDQIRRAEIEEGCANGGRLPFFLPGGNYNSIDKAKAITDRPAYRRNLWEAFDAPAGPWTFEDPGDLLAEHGLSP